LVSSLQLLQASSLRSRNSGSDPNDPNGRGRGRRGGGFGMGTLLYDSIYLASDELLSKQQGRKAIIVLTYSADHGSQHSLLQAIETAQRADTIVYSIYFSGMEGGQQRRMGGMGGGGGRRGGGYPGGGYPGGGGGWPGSGGGWPGGSGGGRYPGG